MRTLTVVAILALTLSHCAKETSKEDKKREEANRQFERMSQAEGSYKGFVDLGDDHIVPAALDLTATRNPSDGGDQPAITGALRIGMFGGVTVSSESASFDSGNGKIALTFKRESGTPLEFRGTLADGKFTDAVLGGPNLGDHLVTLAADGKDLFSSQDQYIYEVEVADDLTDKFQPNAQLDLKRLSKPRTAPATSDLPLLPPLDASLRFINFGVAPQTVKDVQYDPLTGIVELFFTDAAKIEMTGIYLPTAVAQLGLADWHPEALTDGVVVVGATNYGEARIGSGFPGLGLTSRTKVSELPPQYFKGTYRGANNGLVLQSIASIEYTNSQGKNTSEYPFPAFPNLRLRVMVCFGTQKLRDNEFDLRALDQVKQKARFTIGQAPASPPPPAAPDASPVMTTVDIQYTDNWDTFTGKFSGGNSSGAIDTSEPQLKMKAVADLTELACSSEAVTPKAVAAPGLDRVRFALSADTALSALGDDEAESNDQLRYTGYIERNGQDFVPAAVEIVPRQGGSGGADSLLVNLTTGFFGPLTIGSDTAVFDWVTGSVTATYKRQSGADLQLKMTLTDDILTDATLTGPNRGSSRLALRRHGPSYFDAGEDAHFSFQLSDGTHGLSSGILDIKRLDSDTPAPASIDLPSLPGLQASLSFKSLAQTPATARAVLYDSLRGTLSLVFSDSSRIDLNRIFLVSSGGTLKAPATVSGTLSVAGSARATVATTRIVGASPDIGLLPPPTFRGFYQGGAPGAMRFRAVGYLDYLGHQGQNTAEYAFPAFPALRLRLAICDPSGHTLNEKVMELGAYEHLTGAALFKVPATGSNPGGDLLLDTGLDWTNMSGTFTVQGGGSSPSGTTAKVEMNAADLGANGCQEPNSTP